MVLREVKEMPRDLAASHRGIPKRGLIESQLITTARWFAPTLAFWGSCLGTIPTLLTFADRFSAIQSIGDARRQAYVL
jgi:hypothetical protein